MARVRTEIQLGLLMSIVFSKDGLRVAPHKPASVGGCIARVPVLRLRTSNDVKQAVGQRSRRIAGRATEKNHVPTVERDMGHEGYSSVRPSA